MEVGYDRGTTQVASTSVKSEPVKTCPHQLGELWSRVIKVAADAIAWPAKREPIISLGTILTGMLNHYKLRFWSIFISFRRM